MTSSMLFILHHQTETTSIPFFSLIPSLIFHTHYLSLSLSCFSLYPLRIRHPSKIQYQYQYNELVESDITNIMGFLRRLFGGGKKHHHPPPQPGGSDGSGQKPQKEKRSWNFVKHNNRRYAPSSAGNFAADSLDANKHAIAVAAATAAVAEAALAAAHAAAEVVRLTGGGRPATSAEVQRRVAEEIAAVKIQSAFRGYLARRALRALKALVKLQALVRGHIVRKKTADMLKRMQTLVRLQTRARAGRVHLPHNNNINSNIPSFNSSLSHYPVTVPEDYEHSLGAYSTKFDGSSILKRCSSNSNYRDIGLERTRFGSSWREESGWNQTGNSSLRNGHIIDDEKNDKILEVDTWKPKPHLNSHHHNSIAHESPSKRSSKGLNPRTAENSPQAFSASSRLGRRGGGPFTPTKSECSWGFFNGYSSHPNYMANTESSRAKVRSHSAPRQRLEFDRYGSNTSFLHQGLWDPTSSHFNRTKLR